MGWVGIGFRDLDVGDDAQDFVVSDDARFVLVSHVTPSLDGGSPLYTIVAHAGASRTPVPGIGAIPSLSIVTLAWSPH
jgi:hypothetical protein